MTKSADFRIQSDAKVYKFCRSRKMQKNLDYLLAKFGVDTAENEPLRARLRARLHIGVEVLGKLNSITLNVHTAEHTPFQILKLGCRPATDSDPCS